MLDVSGLGLPVGSIVVPFCGSYLGSYKGSLWFMGAERLISRQDLNSSYQMFKGFGFSCSGKSSN